MSFTGRPSLLLRRAWDSPTLTTGASFAVRSLGLLLVLPLALRRFEAQEMAVFLLFNLIIALRALLDFGFSLTVVRSVSYAWGGAAGLQPGATAAAGTRAEPNWRLLGEVTDVMRRIYNGMALLALAVFGLGGTLAVARPIRLLDQPAEAWAAWAIIPAGLAVNFWGTRFATFLQGLNQVALVRRWEAVFSVLGSVAAGAVLLGGGGLLGVIAVSQAFLVLGALRNRWLARRALGGWLAAHRPGPVVPERWREIWAPAWRTGLGLCAGWGAVQLTGLLLAQAGQGAELASLLLGLRLMSFIGDFARSPFYSRLPQFSRLMAQGDRAGLLAAARRGMLLTYAGFLTLWIGLGVAGPWLLAAVGSRTSFPDPVFWSLLGLAFLLHRFGGMHLQLYLTTNRVNLHIADGGAGVIYVGALALLLPRFRGLAMPLAMLAAYGGFYVWYALAHSYGIFGRPLLRSEGRVAVPSLILALSYTAIHVIPAAIAHQPLIR